MLFISVPCKTIPAVYFSIMLYSKYAFLFLICMLFLFAIFQLECKYTYYKKYIVLSKKNNVYKIAEFM
jgi:hypothetical protein